MPGTVQVSILELTGLPCSRSSSSMTIKVSLGKHTCEAEGANGDFLLPLATLRDNLVVKVYDTEGNEIANTGVKSRLIAEKGSWDDLFPLEGGGHVHMRLKFSLSEEERVRIQNMRESALKKKQDELLNKSKSDLQAVVASSGGRDEMFSTAAISGEAPSIDLSLEASSKTMSSKSSSEPNNSSASIQAKEDDLHYILKEQSPLEESPSNVKEDGPSYNLKEQIKLEKPPTKVKEDEPRYNLKEQSSLQKPPSKVKDEDPLYNLKEQSPLEKTSSKVKDDDLRYNLKEQSPLEKIPSKVKEDDLRHNLKEQNPLENMTSEVKEGNLHYNLKEKNPLQQTPSKVKEDDQCYSFKEQGPMENLPTKVKEDDQHHNMKERSTLEIPPGKIKEVDRRHKLKEQSPLEKPPSKVKEDDSGNKLREQTPLEKTPSKVWKTVAAFESSLQSQGWMAAAKTLSGRETTDAHFKEETSESISAQNVESLEYRAERVKRLQELPTSTRNVIRPIENRSTSYEPKDVDNMEPKSKEISAAKELKGKYPSDNILESEEREPSNELCRSSNLEQHETSGRVLDSLSDENQPSNSVTEQEYASGDHLKNHCGRMSAELPGSRCRCSCLNFHGWIFLEEAICSCIASDNRVVINLLEDYIVNPKTCLGKLVDEVTSSKDVNRSGKSKKPESNHSSGDAASRGPNGQPGQVMKMLIMVGFGLLVLFTRKRKPR